MQHLRLFWAINLPPELKKYLHREILSPLQVIPADLKWVEENNVHLTLQFLGDVERGRVNEIFSAVEKDTGGFGPLKLEVKGVGFFPARKAPRVFWAGLGGQVDKLSLLQAKIQEAHVPLGYKPEKKPFSPHITLARFRSQGNSTEFKQKVCELVPDNRKLGEFKVEAVELMQSTLLRSGPVYRVLERVIL